MKSVAKIFAAALASASVAASAIHAPGHAAAKLNELPFVAGEVKRVDKEGGKITLKHDAIPNLGMDGMTMVFRVQEPAVLDKLKAGDKVKFKADHVKGAFTVTEIAARR